MVAHIDAHWRRLCACIRKRIVQRIQSRTDIAANTELASTAGSGRLPRTRIQICCPGDSIGWNMVPRESGSHRLRPQVPVFREREGAASHLSDPIVTPSTCPRGWTERRARGAAGQGAEAGRPAQARTSRPESGGFRKAVHASSPRPCEHRPCQKGVTARWNRNCQPSTVCEMRFSMAG